MNNGKICVSICAKTVDELFEKFREAEPLADVIEARFDCLDSSEFDLVNFKNAGSVLNKFFSQPHRKRYDEVPILSTLRPKAQGGNQEFTDGGRAGFWNSGYDFEWGDFEEDIIEDSFDRLWKERICSFHDFSGKSGDVSKIYERLSGTGASILKIAVQANEITDAIPLWKLLDRAKSEGRPFVPIAMGEAGKWTRILGLAHGAFMTYASLETGSETAPGQISVQDMIDVFRVKELDAGTDVYGIVAGNTSYSVSPWMHNAAFKASGLNSVFVPLQVADLDAFFTRMVSPATREIDLNFKGFSVTNPHKQTIIPYLDEIDETAEKIGAVNTVKIEDGNLYGYNTDAPGFIQPLKKSNIELKGIRVAVFGAGGAARACIYSLQREGANVTVVARNAEKGQLLADEFGIESRQPPVDGLPADFDIIVNTTPLGTAGPAEELAILKAAQLEGAMLVYDLVYNPSETALIREARMAAVPTIGGLEMLIAQGVKQFEIWTGASAPVDAMRTAVRKRLGI